MGVASAVEGQAKKIDESVKAAVQTSVERHNEIAG